MKHTHNSRHQSKGFTLAELLVAMSITLVLVSLTMIITGSAIDAWKGARTEIRAAGQAKIMLNALSRDLESMVIRSGNNYEWLLATARGEAVGPEREKSPNAVRMIFLTGASDRYNGQAGTSNDGGGDVSSVSYELDYADPVWGDRSDEFSTFILYRKLLDPDKTFTQVVHKDDLEQAFRQGGSVNELADLMCENVYEFTTTFIIDYLDSNGDRKTTSVPVMSNITGTDVVNSFSITGNGLEPNGQPNSEFRDGKVTSIELSITVLSDEGVKILKKRQFRRAEDKASFIEENGFRYSSTVIIPQF